MLTSIRSKMKIIAALGLVLPTIAIGALSATTSAVAAVPDANPQIAMPELKAILHQNVVGGAVTVIGENFLPNANVDLYALFRDGTRVTLGQAWAGRDGKFQIEGLVGERQAGTTFQIIGAEAGGPEVPSNILVVLPVFGVR
jgi:hypothetical protein